MCVKSVTNKDSFYSSSKYFFLKNRFSNCGASLIRGSFRRALGRPVSTNIDVIINIKTSLNYLFRAICSIFVYKCNTVHTPEHAVTCALCALHRYCATPQYAVFSTPGQHWPTPGSVAVALIADTG